MGDSMTENGVDPEMTNGDSPPLESTGLTPMLMCAFREPCPGLAWLLSGDRLRTGCSGVIDQRGATSGVSARVRMKVEGELFLLPPPLWMVSGLRTEARGEVKGLLLAERERVGKWSVVASFSASASKLIFSRNDGCLSLGR